MNVVGNSGASTQAYLFSNIVEQQINALKSQERGFAEERNKSSHRITEIRSQLKAMMRADEKIAENENKVYSLRSELARVRFDRSIDRPSASSCVLCDTVN